MSVDRPVGNEVSAAMAKAHRPAVGLAGPYGHPFHPILVTLPIGAWVAAVAFDVASHAGGDERTFAPGAFWLVVIGVAGALAAAVFGLLDLRTLAPGTKARRVALIHMVLNLSTTALFAISLIPRRSFVDQPTEATPWSAIALSAVALAALGVSGWLGGMLSYRYGVRVADESDQADGHRAAAS